MTTHLEESLERDIQRIQRKIVEMGGLVERALRDAVKALVDGDRQLANAVVLRDQYIDEKEKEIDRLCLEFLVKQQPVAGPLRLVYSTIKINVDLERLGDYAESMARQMLRLEALPERSSAPLDGVLELAGLSIPMLHDAIEAFVRQDPDLANKTIAIEPTVDILQSKLNADLVRLFHDQKISLDVLDPLMNIGRRLERVSDQARNICMEVLYICTGEYAKHSGAEAFRILFVDDHNSCRSQIAEAFAHSLNQPNFVFGSAGLEPRPIDPGAIAFMREKGFDLTRMTPKAYYNVPYLDHYQVIVTLSKDAEQAFPPRPRKTVYLDWSIADPSKVQGPPEEVTAAYESAFQHISTQVKDLVEAIVGNKIE